MFIVLGFMIIAVQMHHYKNIQLFALKEQRQDNIHFNKNNNRSTLSVTSGICFAGFGTADYVGDSTGATNFF